MIRAKKLDVFVGTVSLMWAAFFAAHVVGGAPQYSARQWLCIWVLLAVLVWLALHVATWRVK